MVLPVIRWQCAKVRAEKNNCEVGGTKIEMGLDANGNGTLQDDEVSETTCSLRNGGRRGRSRRRWVSGAWDGWRPGADGASGDAGRSVAVRQALSSRAPIVRTVAHVLIPGSI